VKGKKFISGPLKATRASFISMGLRVIARIAKEQKEREGEEERLRWSFSGRVRSMTKPRTTPFGKHSALFRLPKITTTAGDDRNAAV